MSTRAFSIEYFGVPWRILGKQWLLVRTYGYAARLLDSLEIPGGAIPPSHVQMLRHICYGLYEQIRVLQSPVYRGQNQWP